MDSFWIALEKIGGFALIGLLFDLAMRPKEKDWLEHQSIAWWVRFDNVNWHNFGRQEAKMVVSIIDTWAGPSLWTFKRWRFASLTTFCAYGLAAFLTSCRVLLAAPAIHAELDRRIQSGHYPVLDFGSGLIYTSVLPELASTILAFALSISLTRLIAEVAAELSVNRVATALTFVGLLIIHLTIAILWTTVVVNWFVTLAGVQIGCLMSICREYGLHALYGEVLASIANDIQTLNHPLQSFIFYTTHPLVDSPVPGGLSTLTYHVYEMIRETFRLLMNVVANGVRVAFAFLFLGSFIFRPLIQVPVSRIWVGLIESKKPFFAVVFGIIGGLIAFFRAL